jgi:hypothetical protein
MLAWKMAAVSKRMQYLKSEAVTILRAKIALSRDGAFVTFGATKVK